MTVSFGPRRGVWIEAGRGAPGTPAPDIAPLVLLDQLYRSVCSMLYNYVPMSGHPGGSVSSGRFVASLLFGPMDYDVSRPSRDDADVLSYAAGHKAMGLYAMWALRNEVLRVAAPELLPEDEAQQLRLEDLLGFRRNPRTGTPLFRALRAKPLDGHPTPATPFVRLSTGASGVGLASSLGLALAALDTYGDDAPRVHVVEGEGGLTPGRVSEALAFAGSAGLGNVVVHVDWNQSSIDSDHVTREGGIPGDYVQWTPMELFHLHDWNVVEVPDGMIWGSIGRAQRQALEIGNGQPTAVVYRTKKGFEYGVEGRASHGAGHKMCSAGFFASLQPAVRESELTMPACEPGATRCAEAATRRSSRSASGRRSASSGASSRPTAPSPRPSPGVSCRRARDSTGDSGGPGRARHRSRGSTTRPAPPRCPPSSLLAPGSETTLRGQLGKVLGHFNRLSEGAFFIAAADLLGSTSVNEGARGFPAGSSTPGEPGSAPDGRGRHLRGRHLRRAVRAVVVRQPHRRGLVLRGVPRAARAHRRAAPRHRVPGARVRHRGALPPDDPCLRPRRLEDRRGRPDPRRSPAAAAPSGELPAAHDGHAHALGAPGDLPARSGSARGTAGRHRPVRHPPDGEGARPGGPGTRTGQRGCAGRLPAPSFARRATGVVVLQESAAAYAFVEEALPLLERDGIDVEVYYVASAELWDRQPEALREIVFPESKAQVAMGITGFTLATLYRWIRSDFGRAHSLHPYQHGHFPGSGPGSAVVAEAGLDGKSQHSAIVKYVEELRARTEPGHPLATSWRATGDPAPSSRR